MANPEQLERLKNSIALWNEWRRRNRRVPIDLRGVDLCRVVLTEADLGETDLSGAILMGANLSRAKFSSSNLTGTDLTGAILPNADLAGANLTKAVLSMANLNNADLSAAILSRADLSAGVLTGAVVSKANLFKADLSGANLSGADLREAELSGVDFRRGILHHTDLRRANLNAANFTEANLSGADLTEAVLLGTIFGDTNLAEANLDSCTHLGSCIIDHGTLVKSVKLPVSFLRGCGLPDQFIDSIPSLFSHAVQFHSCFISYSTKDQQFADRLHADLQNNGVRCWFAPEDLKIGDHFRNRIDKGIRLHDKLLIILSEHSVQSPWVAIEVESAFEREYRQKEQPVLFPIRLDDVVMKTGEAWAADIRRTRQIGDFTCWKDHDSYQRAFNRLLRDLITDEADAERASVLDH